MYSERTFKEREDQAKKLYDKGCYKEAIDIFYELLLSKFHTDWIHYHLAKCHNKLRSPNVALYHLSLAEDSLKNIEIAVEKAKAFSSLGDTESLIRICSANVVNPTFCKETIGSICSSSSLKATPSGHRFKLEKRTVHVSMMWAASKSAVRTMPSPTLLEGADVLQAQAVGWTAEISAELSDCVGVGLLGRRQKIADRHVLDHATAQRADIGHLEPPV